MLDASSLTTNPLNKRTLVDDLRIKRGRIIADDGTVLAKSIRAPADLEADVSDGPLFAQPVGYLNALEGKSPASSNRARLICAGCRRG